jgi:hypothetical protein
MWPTKSLAVRQTKKQNNWDALQMVSGRDKNDRSIVVKKEYYNELGI